ncbi:hypothetical protein, partial [Pseudomonas syringae group genomosp. 7]|uniref:hypothetical protein n=1 Tax=Pseudomonas syringae group genomosp. 7 TaxID=251699 RepID=UPI003770365E
MVGFWFFGLLGWFWGGWLLRCCGCCGCGVVLFCLCCFVGLVFVWLVGCGVFWGFGGVVFFGGVRVVVRVMVLVACVWVRFVVVGRCAIGLVSGGFGVGLG